MPDPHRKPRCIASVHPFSWRRRMAAWCVHLLTASGIVCYLFAIEAGTGSDWRTAFAWLAMAVMIDAIDGAVARWVGVKQVLPQFDGALLDNVIDYVGYVVVPAFFLLRAELVLEGMRMPLAAVICMASAYQFCQSDAKTDDHYFKGFPSYWNIAFLYLLAWRLPSSANVAILGLLVILVFVPIKYIYPTRTPQFRKQTLFLTVAWGLSILGMIWQLPQPSRWLANVSFLYVIYYVGASLLLTFSLHRRSREVGHGRH